MDKKEILNFIEDKGITIGDNWYFHATSNDIGIVKKILEKGIKSGCLRDKKGNHFNGKYYISLYQDIEIAESLKLWLIKQPKFIVHDISPFYADRNKFDFRKFFINTRIPLRTSEWDGEFHQYLQIEPVKIIALEYSLFYILSDCDEAVMKENLKFIRDIVLCLQQLNRDLPIYDTSSYREINKNKVLSLNL